jgi:hypothetical protein
MTMPKIRFYDAATGGFKQLTGKATPEQIANMSKADQWAYKQWERAEDERQKAAVRAAEKAASLRQAQAYRIEGMQRREAQKQKAIEQRERQGRAIYDQGFGHIFENDPRLKERDKARNAGFA